MSLSAPTCFTEMVEASELEADTPHAAIPGRTVGEIAAALNSEGGQLDIANARGRAIVGIGKTCDRWAQEAKRRAEKRRGLF